MFSLMDKELKTGNLKEDEGVRIGSKDSKSPISLSSPNSPALILLVRAALIYFFVGKRDVGCKTGRTAAVSGNAMEQKKQTARAAIRSRGCKAVFLNVQRI